MANKNTLGPSLSRLSRRDFLRLAGIASGGLALTACGLDPTKFPDPTATAAAMAAEPIGIPTIQPTPELIFEKQTTEWIAQNPPSQDLITKGMETGIIREKEDVNRLTFDIHPNLNHPGEVIVFGRDPDTNEILLATRTNPEIHETDWQVAGLRDFADATGITVGSQLYSPNNGLYSDNDIRKINELVTQEYNHAIIIEVGWAFLEKNQENKFDFRAADAAVDLALANRMTVEGDDLIYGRSDFNYSFIGQIEDKLRSEGLNDEQIKTRLEGIVKNHITQIVSHFKGRITEWSVLNEWSGQNTQRPDIYSKIWKNDQEFVKMVFETARAADPSARLFYNDADNISRSRYGYKYNLALVQFLQQNGIIDALGLQFTDMDVANHPSEDEIIATMQSYGIPVIVSSATFNITGVSGTPEEIDAKQAEVAVLVMDACIKSTTCKDFRMWDGYGDKFSFEGPEARASIFDENMKPKLAYWALREYLTLIIDKTSE